MPSSTDTEDRMSDGAVRQVNIGQEMRAAYLDYAMSVIVARRLRYECDRGARVA